MKRVLVTGGGGFVASWLLPVLVGEGWSVRATMRRATRGCPPAGVEAAFVDDLKRADWESLLADIDAVVHLAGRAHRMGEGTESAEAYHGDNVGVTEALAREAARRGVQSFVSASSVKAMGEATPLDAPWNEESPCRPIDSYGATKLKAEEALRAMPGLRATILRLPLVYGPGVKGNMAQLWRLVRAGWPLPLAGVRNKRSLLFVGNLSDAILRCLHCESAQGETFLLRDGEDLSTPELIRRIARAENRPSRLFPVPAGLLRTGASLVGRGASADRLLGSLVVDDSKIRTRAAWLPPFSVDEGLAATARGIA